MLDPYSDQPQPIGYGASIAAPYMHASALELLKNHIKQDSHILDVGAGSGYMSSCFARLLLAKFGTATTGYVVGIETVPSLVEKCIENIRNDDPSLLESKRIRIIQGDGHMGSTAHEPFDVIYVGAAAQEMPNELIRQLKPGGIMRSFNFFIENIIYDFRENVDTCGFSRYLSIGNAS
jgi:protein-L-isoaspartate(D-aspartate) O-methyltransferase